MAASLRVQKGDSIIFQLLRRDVAVSDSKWEELQVVEMLPKPTVLNYTYAPRNAYYQTIEDQGFIDKYGMAPTGVTLSGSFGIQIRRSGISFKDGYTRFWEFREQIVKLSQRVSPMQSDGKHQYVYAVNYYDFINDEKFAADIRQLGITMNARYNPRERTYSVSVMRIGPLIANTTRDPMLLLLLAADKVLDMATSGLDSLNNLWTSSPVYTAAGLTVGGMDVLGGQLASLVSMGSKYSSHFKSMVSPQTPVTNGKSLFGIKF